MVKIRLARGGRKKSPFYKIVVCDSRSPRDGRFIEQIGYFNPLLEGLEGFSLNMERIEYWMGVGAQASNRIKSLYNCAKKASK
jgi:small subunit ribosomal protein S16